MDNNIDHACRLAVNSSGGDLDDHVSMEDPILHHQIHGYSSVWPNLPLHHHQLHQISSSTTTHNPPPHHRHDVPPPSSTHDHRQLIVDHHHQVLLAAGSNNNFMELDDQEEDQEAAAGEEELGTMKEMMYKIAAMQPVDIDPATIRKPKRRNVRISEDPQSVAARHRRERISEKIRVLQRLVPGGTKMDTASMLDEAIRYVKFLKRQIRLLQSSSSSSSNNINIDQHHLAPSAAADDDHNQCNINIINHINSSPAVVTTGAGLPPLDWPPSNIGFNTSTASSSTKHPDH